MDKPPAEKVAPCVICVDCIAPDTVPVKDIADKAPVDGLYVNGPVTSSTYKTFDDVFVLLNGIKYVPEVLSDVNAILLAFAAVPKKAPLKLVAVILPVDGLQEIKLHFCGLP
jgi:hypothetical protein